MSEPRPAPPPDRRRNAVQALIGAVLGAMLLVAVFHDVEPSALAAELRGMRWGWWLAVVAASCGMHLARSWRWHVIVRGLQPLPFRETLSVNSLGMMAIQLLPLRLGELLRPYLLTERRGVPFGGAVYTVVLERTLDLLALATVFAAAVLFADLPLDAVRFGDWEVRFVQEGQRAIGVALVPFVGGLVALAFVGRRAVGWVEALVGRIHGGLGRRLGALLGSFLDGLASLRDPRFAVAATGATAVAWLLNAAVFWLLAEAFGLDLPWMAGVVLLSVFMVGMLLPAPPLFAGVFEAFVIGGLALYAVPKDAAAALAVVCHLTQLVLLFAWGLPFLWLDGLSFGRLVALSRAARARSGAGR